MEKNKKKQIIISSSLTGILGVSGALGTAITLSSCTNEENKEEIIDKTKPYFYSSTNENNEIVAKGSPNTFLIQGKNLRVLNKEAEKKKISVKTKDNKKVDFSITVKNNDKMTITINTLYKKNQILNCYYDNEIIGTINYIAYPVFENGDIPIAANSKFDPEFDIIGKNLDLVREGLTIKDENDQPVRFALTINKEHTLLKVSIRSKIKGNKVLNCYYRDFLNRNMKIATLNYIEPRPVWLSDFIDDWKVNDIKKLDTNEQFPTKLINIKLNESFKEFKVTQNVFKNSKQFKDIESEKKSKLPEFAKLISLQKIKLILGEDYLDKYDLLFNIKNNNGIFEIACQVNEKGALEGIDETTQREIPYFAFKFIFDFRNTKVEMNQDDFLFLNGMKTRAEFELYKEKHVKENFLDFNNELKILNTKILDIIQKEDITKNVKEWNRTKLSNNDFFNGLKPKINSQIQKNINIIGYFADMIQKIGDMLANNKTIEEFLYGLRQPIVEFLTLADANQYFIDFIDLILQPDGKIGIPGFPPKNTYFWYLQKLNSLGIIKGKLFWALNGLFTILMGQKKQLIKWLMNLNENLVNEAVKQVGSKLGEKFSPLFEQILNFLSKLRDIAPNRYIGGLRILDSIADGRMKDQLLAVFKAVIIAVAGKEKGEEVSKLKKLWKQIGWNVPNLQGLFRGIFYPLVDGREMRLADYFKNNVKLVTVRESLIQNSDNQTFKIDSVYRLNFIGNLKINLRSLCTMVNDIKISTIAELLGKKMNFFVKIIADAVGKLRKALPNDIHLKSSDYVEFRIKDDNAFLVPRPNGYSIKAKQSFIASFTGSIDETFSDLLGKWGFITSGIVKGQLKPYVDTLKDYYMKLNYWTNISNGIIKDEKNGLNEIEKMYDGYNYFDLTQDKINRVKSVLRPHVEKFIATPNMDATFEIKDVNVKREVLRILGLDENMDPNLVKFIFNMTPGFLKKANQYNKAPYTNVDLNVDLGLPLLKLDEDDVVRWINSFEITNIRNS